MGRSWLGGAGMLLALACAGPLPQGDGGPVLGAGCPPGAFTDPCLSSGLVCHADATGLRGSCDLGFVGEPCHPEVGCDQGAGFLACNTLPAADGGDARSVCAPVCASAADCPDATTDCFPVAAGDAGACLPNPCATLFSLCAVGGSSVGGTCLPPAGRGSGAGDVCVQSGLALLGRPCSTSRDDGGAWLCEPGDACVVGPHSGQSACAPVCGASQTCPGTRCVAQLGLCLASCVPEAAPSCASPFTCLPVVAASGMSLGNFCQLP